jgi:hypothetical protein
LKKGLARAGVRPFLEFNKLRVMNIFEIKNVDEGLDASALQNIFQDYGVHLSVKQYSYESTPELHGRYFARVSGWTYNTETDFITLKNCLNNNL